MANAGSLHDAIPPDPNSKVWAIGLSVLLFAIGYRVGNLSARAGTISEVMTYEEESGRLADKFSDVPVRGWKDLLRVCRNVSQHRVVALAAGVTFYSLLAIFPAIAALVAVYGLLSDPVTITAHLDTLSGFLPGGAIDVTRDQLIRVASKGSQTLGLTFFIGFAVSLWSANAATKSLFDTLNIIYGEREKRGFVKLNFISLSFTLGAIFFVLLAIGAVVILPVMLNYVGTSNRADLLLRVGRWPALFIVVTPALSFIYRYGASREAPRWSWITWGSAVAALLWLAASSLFSWYAASFGKYNETYGSLGAVIGFMTWLWISGIVILIVAEVDSEMEHQTTRDTTVELRKPMGARGTKMADSSVAAQSNL